MLSIYEELLIEKEIDIGIEEYLNKYIKIYNDIYVNKDINELYNEYNKIKKEENISSLRELEILNDNPSNEELENTYFLKSIKIESLKRVLKNSETENKKISEKINKYKKNNLKYYPIASEYKDYDKFLKDLSMKKEFAIHYIPKKNKNSCDSIFELAPHQLFLKNYLSPNTPYSSILIFHGVGVGKTCSGVSMAENFKDLLSKTIILAPEKIQSGWKKNIYDPFKEDNQCTQGEYINEEDIYENKEKAAKKRIKENYEMYGYLSFANSVKKYLQENTRVIPSKDLIMRKRKEIELIKEKYSNRVLIIDEVHKIRSEDSLIKERDTILYIEKVIKYSDNLKLILLTANPMFNQPEEIIWILNMLRLNDKKELIRENINFDDKNNLTDESIKLIKDNSKGYISYLRGENPVTFPYRIDISQIKQEKNKVMKSKGRTIFGTDNKNKNMKFMELYASPLKGKQFKQYVEAIRDIRGKETIHDVTYYGKMLQITNCIYPVDSDDIEDCYGTRGLQNCFNIMNKKPVKYTLKKGIPNFLDLDQLGGYSSKIETIIKKINNSDGIVFIYSNYLDGGIMPLVLALEQNGYTKYDKEEILISDKKRKPISYLGKDVTDGDNRATYSVIAGSSLKLTNDFENELRVLNSPDNKNGQKIKVVIGSTVAAEGLDFKNIRSIHLMEPWHNINKLEQVIGRGIRNCSHAVLDPGLRNVTIYLHSSELKNNESIETYLYHSCEDKATQIGNIENILKEISIDKYLFQYSNIIKESDVDEMVINPCLRGDNRFKEKPFDKSFSRTCSFLEKCDYIDQTFTIDDIVKDNKTDESTFSINYSQPVIDTYKKYISAIIADYVCLSYNNIVDKMKEKFENFIDDILNHSLDQMITDKYTIVSNRNKGYIKFTDNYYIFQPIDNEDIFLPSYYRINKGKSDKSDYRLELDNFSLLDIPESQGYEWSGIKKTYDFIINYFADDEKSESRSNLKGYITITNLKDKGKNLFNKKVIYSFVIERLSFRDKCKLLYSLLEYILEGTNVGDKKYKEFIEILVEIMCPLFIYSDDDTANYEWYPKYEKKNKNKLYGGFIYYHERNECVLFRYNSKQLILCNNVIKDNIMMDYKKISPEKIFSKEMFGTLIYNKNIGEELPFSNIVLKHKRKEDKNGKGKIVLQGGWAELKALPLRKYIIREHKNEIGCPETVEGECELLVKIGTDKKIITFALELILRKSEDFIPGDLLWLYYY